MNRQLLSSMREQMVPSDAAKAALLDALAKPRRRPALPRYATAIAACAVLAVGVLGYRYIAQPLHSYIKWSMLTENFHTGALIITENDVDSGGGEGDRDQVMTSRELRSAMTGAGFSPAEAEDYLSGGWQMTWAKWWKFLHQTKDGHPGAAAGPDRVSLSGEDFAQAITDAGFSQDVAQTCLLEGWRADAAAWDSFLSLEDTSDQALLAFHQTQEVLRDEADGIPIYTVPPTMEELLTFSQEELAVNTGDLDAQADQSESVLAYQNLMDHFAQTGGYPDWYGGAYIDSHAGLVVLTVGDQEKAFYQQIWAWAGSERIGFSDAKYSLGTLRRVQQQAADAMHELGLLIGCGVNEELNRVELHLNGITRGAQVLLARLDPDDDIIQVYVSEDTNAYTPAPEEDGGVQPSGVPETPPHPGTAPQPNSVPEEEDPTPTIPQAATYDLLDTDDEDLIAYEPIDPTDPTTPVHGPYSNG